MRRKNKTAQTKQKYYKLLTSVITVNTYQVYINCASTNMWPHITFYNKGTNGIPDTRVEEEIIIYIIIIIMYVLYPCNFTLGSATTISRSPYLFFFYIIFF